ncbi:hypothetical protein ACMUMQ_00880 [Marinomonas sp. 2405UD66-6]|uniref:hypothetical protein n=1 Tax=Marinomonas sp. 2405UD66-6 TaxID=3391834 RepID=UPI0039C93048
MNIKKTLLNTTLVLVTAATLAACGQESEETKVEDTLSSAGETVEQTFNDAGAAVDQTIDEAGEALNNAGSELDDIMTDAGNTVEDTCEEVKEGMDATDTNC